MRRYIDDKCLLILIVILCGSTMRGQEPLKQVITTSTVVVDTGLVVIPENEYNVLCLLYEATNGESWQLNQPWDITQDVVSSSNWEGITFNTNGEVVAIDLSAKQMAGELPQELFQLPHLTSLNLSNNTLYGDIYSLFSVSNTSVYLDSIDLSSNMFTGCIPYYFATLPYLATLNLSNNQLEAIEYLLPLSINLDITNQTILIPPIELVENPQIDLPTICLYNHSSQMLVSIPIYSITSNGHYLQYDGTTFTQDGSNIFTLPNGSAVDVLQYNNSAAGTHIYTQIYFNSGDAKMDGTVDLYDVQATLNYIQGDIGTTTFNTVAADTYTDSLINIQDIVSTINITLETPVVESSSSVSQLRSSTEALSHIYMEGNAVVIENADTPITAMDIILEGVSSSEIALCLNQNNYLFTTRDTSDGVRIILLCINGEGIPIGKQQLFTLSHTNATIKYVALSDREAEPIPVIYVQDSSTLGVSTTPIQDKSSPFIKELSNEVERAIFTLYNLSGKCLLVENIKNTTSSSYNLYELAAGVPPGIYLCRWDIWMGEEKITESMKIIIAE